MVYIFKAYESHPHEGPMDVGHFTTFEKAVAWVEEVEFSGHLEDFEVTHEKPGREKHWKSIVGCAPTYYHVTAVQLDPEHPPIENDYDPPINSSKI